jgi:hypothetical protein
MQDGCAIKAAARPIEGAAYGFAIQRKIGEKTVRHS